MIKITDEIYVAEDQIFEIGLTSNQTMIYVKTKSGEIFHKLLTRGISIYTQLDNMAKEIDAKLK